MRARVFFPVLSCLLILAVAAALLAAGCGEKRDHAGELREAAEEAVAAGSFHAQLNAVITPLEGVSGMGLTAQGDAWLDMDPVVAEARLTVLGMEISVRYIEEKPYLQMGGQWYEVPASVLQEMGWKEGVLPAALDVLASAPEVVSHASSVSEVGRKKVSGRECTELAVDLDLQGVVAMPSVRKLAEELDMSQDEMLAFLEDAEPEMRVCVQRDEPVVRQIYLAFSSELPELGGLAGMGLLPRRARVELTMDLPEYGMEVKVEAPSGAKPFKGL